MDDFGRCHVPAFGSWEFAAGLPYTQCFESARQSGGFHHYSRSEGEDLYVTGDLYENDVAAPAVIVVPRRRGKARHQQVKEARKGGWVGAGDFEKQPPSPVSPPPPLAKVPKAVDEDLYQISPQLLHGKRRRRRSIFSSCLLPICA
ncbi:hypothetical protein NMG60_11014313 [Bertholletia excelsa]